MDYFYLYLIVINLIGFLIMKIDKDRARKRQWRIPEAHIWLISLIGGSIGTTFGMFTFRHKTKHVSFRFGLPILILIQIAGLIML